MSLSPADETGLVLPLFDGLFEVPMWETFLRRLMQRTGAQRVLLTMHNVAAPSQPPLHRCVPADATAPFALPALSALRPNRVYSLDELRDFGNPARREERDAELAEARVGDARLIRISGGRELNLWIVLLHAREVFAAADSALLTALVPAMISAMTMLASIGQMRRRSDMAEEALALLGIGQAALDEHGRVLVTDRLAAEHLPLPQASATQQGQPNPAVAQACAELALAPQSTRQTVTLGEDTVLLRPIHPEARDASNPAVAIAAIRLPRCQDPASGAAVIARAMGLSQREAALAEAISRGVPIVEAGAALQLTSETARNYSKRIYAKTSTSGQADLVRKVLSGLAPLA